ncbi:4'-phosphopantetheinyl transferase family protein [Streptomyces heilongjiangensis]|uniref:4'-phosphopantetheinyl transferase family protein n=1 Tax=Streptomyces heilongjiangensis TaxID=945052 RepID=A0ABW1BHC2_9ACTN|nr:4'-phosphopantetheinyl transferase superfamily protein [Streptomyces heilongjiangensis]MDC2948624.1 4'-phosphopantetheinyl transferase superfamily protein [Streptomyces heilongjiangensis]
MSVRRGLAGPPPLRVASPDGPWEALRGAVRDGGYGLAYGLAGDWAPAARGPALRALLGHEHGRYLALNGEEARTRFAVSRLLLKHAAAAVLGADPADLELARRPNGRPYLRGCGRLDVSLSHTGDVVAVGLSRLGPVGVDVEPQGRAAYGTGLEEDVCTAHERAALGWLPEEDRNAAVIRLWTLKEAYTKALGLGTRLSFRSFGFTTPSTGTAAPRLLGTDGLPADDGGWHFETHAVDDRCTLSAAVGPAPRAAAGPVDASGMVDDGLMRAVVTCSRKDALATTGADRDGDGTAGRPA